MKFSAAVHDADFEGKQDVSPDAAAAGGAA